MFPKKGELMKSLILFVTASLVSVSAYAWPNAGNNAVYSGSYSQASQPAPTSYTVTETVVELDAAHGEITVRYQSTLDGSDQQTSGQLSDFQKSAQNAAAFLASCETKGGQRETLTTPAGTFKTCKASDDDGYDVHTFWYADVPFGYAKYVRTSKEGDGAVDTQVLKSYQ